MVIRHKMYPYPVLADFLDDYVNSKFDVTAEVVAHGYDRRLYFNVTLKNEGLQKLIKLHYNNTSPRFCQFRNTHQANYCKDYSFLELFSHKSSLFSTPPNTLEFSDKVINICLT